MATPNNPGATYLQCYSGRYTPKEIEQFLASPAIMNFRYLYTVFNKPFVNEKKEKDENH